MKRRAKVRGVRRRLKRLRLYVGGQTDSFPTTFHDGYWHNKIPIDQPFLLSIEENSRMQHAVIEAMMEGASRLVRLREQERYRIVVLIDLPTLWQSELLVFESDARLKTRDARTDVDALACRFYVPTAIQPSGEHRGSSVP